VPDNCQVLHSIPGRTRLHLGGCQLEATLLEARVRALPGVNSALFSPISQNLVVHHNFKWLPTGHIKRIGRFFGVAPAPSVIPETIGQELKELAVVGAIALGEGLLFQGLPKPLLSATALATLYASRHQIKEGLKNILRPTAETLTTTSLLALIATKKTSPAFTLYALSTVGELLSHYTADRTRGFVRDMMALDVSKAWLLQPGGDYIEVEVSQVQKGDSIMVFHGEKVPLDGTVSNYEGEVDQASITGESTPVYVTKGHFIYAGSLLVDGKLELKVENVGEDLTVNKMIRLIEEGQDKQAHIQNISEKFTQRMVPVSFALAGLTYLFTRNWDRVLNMLVIDYICGVKLATATAISATIGKAARNGILIKGGQAVENLSRTNTVILDKTGTITEGNTFVKSIHALNGFSEEDVLSYAAAVEAHSTHPIANSIVEEAKKRSLALPQTALETFENLVGRGIVIEAGGERVLAGSRKLQKEFKVSLPTEPKTGVFISKNGELMGIIDVDDKIRPQMKRTINHMKRNGIDEIIMLTGDHKKAAAKVAQKLDIDQYYAEALPQDKANFLRSLKKDSRYVTMMVGDGINDAPALAYADIGVSLGSKKTDIAMETSDVIIHSENPMLLGDVIDLSQTTMKVIRQNLVATFAINTGAIALGSFGIISPVMAAAIHNAATIGVVLNSAKLLLPERG